MPPTTTGGAPTMEAPLPATPFTVSNSRFVSYSHRIEPSFVEKTRMAPSFEPEKISPGMTAIAAACAALQPRPVPHFGAGGAVNHTRCPVARSTACNPPGLGRELSATGKYACSESTAEPHSMPPFALPSPARYCHIVLPF